MLQLRATLSWVLMIAVMLSLAGPAPAQDADADQAKALLRRGIEQFDSQQFETAKATLLKVDVDALSERDRTKCNSHLAMVDTAIRRQRQARQAYRDAEAALRDANFDAAMAGYRTAAESSYLPEAERRDAAAQLELARRKADAAHAGATRDPEPTAAIEAEPVSVEPEPVGEDSETASTESDVILAAADDAATVAPDSEPEEDAEPEPADETSAASALAAERQAKADGLLSAAKQALDDGQMEVAVQLLERVLVLDEDNAEAKELYEFASRRAGGGAASETGAMSELRREMMIARQVAQLEIDTRMKRSRERLAEPDTADDFDKAAELANSAMAVLENNESVFPPAVYRNEMLKIEQYLRYIRKSRTEWEERKKEEQRIEAAEEEAERQRRERIERERKVDTLMNRARTLRDEHHYEQALEVTEELLALAPDNEWALEHRGVLEEFVIMADMKDAEAEIYRQGSYLLAETEWKKVPWHELLHFPRSWDEIRKRAETYGARATAEPEEDRVVRQKLERRIQLDVDAVGLQDVINFLRNVSGVNFWVNWTALDEHQLITKSTPVTAHLEDVTVRKALEVVLSDAGGDRPLEYVIEEGVVTISTQDDLAQKHTTRVYDIQHLLFTVPNFMGPRTNLSDTDTSDTGGDDDDNVGFTTTFDDTEDTAQESMTKAEMIQDLIDTITQTVKPGTWEANPDLGIRTMHGQLIVTHTADAHQDLAKLLNQLGESRSIQINIEARFITVSTGFLNAIGVDFDVYFNLGSSLNAGNPVVDPFTGALVPTVGGTGWEGRGYHGDMRFTPMGVETGLQHDANKFGNVFGSSSGLPGSIGSQVASPGLEIAGTFLDDVQVDFLLQATQAHRATRTLTAPRVTIWNGQRAYVSVATQRAYISGYEAATDAFDIDVDDAAVDIDFLVPDIDTVSTGTTLDVEATVSHDRKYVILTVRPQVTTLEDILTQDIPGLGPIELPILGVQEVMTTVMVPDRGTLLLGGQTLAGEIEQELGVPLVSKIPVLNRLYTNRGKVRDEQTLLILIRPEIIIHEYEEARQKPE